MGLVGEPNYPATLINKLLPAVTREHSLLVTCAPSTDRADRNKGIMSRWGFLFTPQYSLPGFNLHKQPRFLLPLHRQITPSTLFRPFLFFLAELLRFGFFVQNNKRFSRKSLLNFPPNRISEWLEHLACFLHTNSTAKAILK
jgi:hypothetical protein